MLHNDGVPLRLTGGGPARETHPLTIKTTSGIPRGFLAVISNAVSNSFGAASFTISDMLTPLLPLLLCFWNLLFCSSSSGAREELHLPSFGTTEPQFDFLAPLPVPAPFTLYSWVREATYRRLRVPILY